MCDTMAVLTDDGVLFAKNSDRDANEAQVLRWYAAQEHASGTELGCTWTTIPQAPATHAVLLSQPWWMWGAEVGANEHGVVIGNEAVFTRRAGGTREEAPLLGMDLVRLGLERGATCHEAVQVIVELLERHGQGGSCSHEHPGFTYDNSYVIADPDGAVVLETAGRRWATEEVRSARSISNGLTIRGFAERYADPVRGRVAGCAVRQRITQSAAGRATGPLDLMRALRDHGDAGDRVAPRWSPVNGALSAPCAHAGGLVTSTQSTASWVADLRPGARGAAGGRHWVTGTSAPCTGLFKPVTVADRVAHEPAAMPDGTADPAYLWWRHERLHRLALRDLDRALPLFGADRDRLERDWAEAPPDGATAFKVGDEAEKEWARRLQGLELEDRRPPWVRRQWRRWDRQAGLAAAVGTVA